MKKLFVLVLLILVAGVATLFYAQAQKGNMLAADKMDRGMMMDEGKYGQMKDMDKMHGMMMHGMMMKNIVATSDGGVIVLAGDTLMKYDKNLILQKETEIKIDWERLQKKMKEMKEKMSSRPE